MEQADAVRWLAYTLGGLVDEGKAVYNLYLTEQCNFACPRCFYGCSPQGPRGYMEDDMLQRAIDSAATLQMYTQAVGEWPIGVDLNSIGGEPTLNLDQFARCIDYLYRNRGNNMGMEMTTNGWWMKEPKFARRFLEAVAEAVERGDPEDNSLSIRISDSLDHEQFRPAWMQGKGKLQSLIAELLESGRIRDESVVFEEWSECDKCEARVDYWVDGDKCEKCEEEGDEDPGTMVGHSEEHVTLPGLVPGGMPWLYVEDQRDRSCDIPSVANGGRGGNDLGARGWCGPNHGVLSFDPRGRLRDACCRGSDMTGFGTVDDDPLVLLTLVNIFLRRRRPTCAECHSVAAEVVEEGLVRAWKGALEDALHDVGIEGVIALLEDNQVRDLEGELV